MALPEEDWLHLAKRCSVGGVSRQHHGRERRPNLVVGNAHDRYWSYCQACKQGGVVMKEHVIITGRKAPVQSTDLTLPPDLVRVCDADDAVQHGVYGFLAHKHMDAAYLPELWFSKSRCRILLMHEGAWLGRDTTEASPQKWLTYNGSTYLDMNPRWSTGYAVVVEDTFSMYKVAWALRGEGIAVFSSLGTSLCDKLMVRLLTFDHITMFYDGDDAGYKGAALGTKRLQSCGIRSTAACAPPGKDPKDMTIHEIRARFILGG